MNNSIVLGNGNLLVNIDNNLNLYDLYWPHVGEQNQLTSKENEIFFFIDGEISYLSDTEWAKSPSYFTESLASNSDAINTKKQVSLRFVDFVVPEKDILIRKIKLKNLSSKEREIRVFFKHNFHLREDDIGDTAVWYPFSDILCHYKKNTYLAVGSSNEIYQHTCAGPFDHNGKGAFPNQYGELDFNPVATGSVQSCISHKFILKGEEDVDFDYFILCGENYQQVNDLANFVREKTTEILFAETFQHWRNWLKENVSVQFFDDHRDKHLVELYDRSLLIMRTQTDNSGAVIAANDSQYIKAGGKDSYSYFWPRDAANAAIAYIDSNYKEIPQKFFEISEKVITSQGYFMHKYYPNIEYGVASSWHPWIDRYGNAQLPIQEDETALVIYALNHYYEKFGDGILISKLWNTLIVPALNFMIDYRYSNQEEKNNHKHPLSSDLGNSNLPLPSYDIWEIHWGVHAYTIATVYGALIAGSKMAEFRDQKKLKDQCLSTANEIKNDFEKYFISKNGSHFINSIYCDQHQQSCTYDDRVDASIIALWKYGMYSPKDSIIQKTMNRVIEKLTIKTKIGGIARKEDDQYMRVDDNIPGNPWFISTLWIVQYYIEIEEIEKAKELLNWVIDRSDNTGLMAEQADPYSGYSLSMKPLTWSHSEFISTINKIIQ